jgi:hypothetical protein
MSETEVVDALGAMKATRASYQKALSFLASSSRVSAKDAEDEISETEGGTKFNGAFRRPRIAIVGPH